VIELQDEELCVRCKRQVLGELRGDYEPGAAYTYGERPGLPWEQPAAGLGGMLKTVKEILFSPTSAFQKMQTRGGLGRPVLFVFLLYAPFTWLSIFWLLLITGTIPQGFSGVAKPIPMSAEVLVGYMFASMAAALLTPFLTAAIFHICLLIVKGAKRDYECTYRVVAYTSGATCVFNIVPIAGGFATVIWLVVVMIIGFSRAHEITGGRAALAFFLPVIVCCGGYIALLASFVSFVGLGG
jgi:hypothetical protein